MQRSKHWEDFGRIHNGRRWSDQTCCTQSRLLWKSKNCGPPEAGTGRRRNSRDHPYQRSAGTSQGSANKIERRVLHTILTTKRTIPLPAQRSWNINIGSRKNVWFYYRKERDRYLGSIALDRKERSFEVPIIILERKYKVKKGCVMNGNNKMFSEEWITPKAIKLRHQQVAYLNTMVVK